MSLKPLGESPVTRVASQPNLGH